MCVRSLAMSFPFFSMYSLTRPLMHTTTDPRLYTSHIPNSGTLLGEGADRTDITRPFLSKAIRMIRDVLAIHIHPFASQYVRTQVSSHTFSICFSTSLSTHSGMTGHIVSRLSTCGPSSKAIQRRRKRSSHTLRVLLLRRAMGEAV